IERKILAHDLDRLGPTGLQVLGPVNGMPEQAHITAAKGFGSGAVLVHVAVHIESSRSKTPSNFVSQSSGLDSLNGANLVFVSSAAADPHRADNFVAIHDQYTAGNRNHFAAGHV